MSTTCSAPHPVTTAEACLTPCRAAVKNAESLSTTIDVAATDAWSSLTAFLRVPSAFFHSMDVVVEQVYTSASFGFPTNIRPQFCVTKGSHSSGSHTGLAWWRLKAAYQ
jgi:uncharacterized protein GlcG (DUF336 family)